MDNKHQIVNVLKQHPGARIVVVSSFFFKAREMFKHISGVIRNEQMRGFKMNLSELRIEGPEGCSVRFLIVGRSAKEAVKEWAGVQCTNVYYDYELGVSLDELLPFLCSLVRSQTYQGPFTVMPLTT